MKYRKDPVRGEVVAKQVHDGLWAYLVFLRSNEFYLCNFLSRGLIADKNQCGHQSWLIPLDLEGEPAHLASPYLFFNIPVLSSAFLTIGIIEVTEDEAFPWKYCVYLQNPGCFLHFIDNSRERVILSKEQGNRYVRLKYTTMEEFPELINSIANRFQVIEGDPDVPLPAPPVQEDTDVVFELSFQGGVSTGTSEMEDAIGDEADHEGISLECMGSDGFSCDKEEASMALTVIRRALKRILPKTEWDFVQIIRRGPEIGKECTYGLLPTPRKKAE